MKMINLSTKLLLSALLPIALQAQEKPNVIVFLVDDMGLMDTSVPFNVDEKGKPVTEALNEWYHTPNMERLARQGIRFSTFYAQSVSSPSRTSIITGQNATRHHTTNWINAEDNNRNTYGPPAWNWTGVKKSDAPLPMVLKENGYKTIHVGKAHFGCMGSEGENPIGIGFDVNIAGSAIGHPGSYLGENGYGHLKGEKARAVPDLEKYHGTETFLTDALTIEATKEIDKAIQENKPFYLNLAHYAVHGPFNTDKRFIHRYKDPSKGNAACAFATLIEGMDKSLGDILDHLEKSGVAENTLILFLGDNGGDAPIGEERGYGSSAPFKGMKATEFEGGMRIPFIASWARPNSSTPIQKRFPISQDAVQTQMGTIMDIYPTLLDVTGTRGHSEHVLDGKSLKKLFTGKKDKEHSKQFLMHFPHQHRGSYFTSFRDGDWKVIYYYNPETPQEPGYVLYNLANDPYEYNDLSKSETGTLKKMMKKMISQLKEEGALYPIDKEGNELQPIMPV